MALIFNEDLSEGFKYIIESERDAKNPFSVTIKPIDSVRLVTLEDGLLKRGQDNSVSVATGSYNISLCLNAITDWENMVDGKGKAIAMVKDIKGYISQESLEMIPTSVITELAEVIASVSQDPSTIQIFKAADPVAKDDKTDK